MPNRKTLIFAILILLTVAFPTYGKADVTVGLTGGLAIPGNQDLKFREHGANGAEIQKVNQKDVDESLGSFVSLNVTKWGNRGNSRRYGLQLETMYWRTSVKPASVPSLPSVPTYTMDQHRVSGFINALSRLPLYPHLGRFPRKRKGRSREPVYAYAGLGAGVVYSNINHGADGWGPGLQLLGGVSIPLKSKFRFRLEGRFLLAPDVDSSPKAGWTVDTSGSPTRWRIHPHLDSQFFLLQLGLDWRL